MLFRICNHVTLENQRRLPSNIDLTVHLDCMEKQISDILQIISFHVSQKKENTGLKRPEGEYIWQNDRFEAELLL